MRCNILILLTGLAMTVGLGTSVVSAQMWKVDFQGDENHNGTYGQNGPRDYTEPGVHWNIFEVAGFSSAGNTNVSTPPTSLELLDTEGNDQGVALTLLTEAWGWANEGSLDDLWGDYLIILNAQGAISDPTDWEIAGLVPNTPCDLTYYHRANIGGRGLNFVANGVRTTVISTSDGYMATATVTTDASGKITGTADSDGFNEGCWAGLVIAIIPTAKNPLPADGAINPAIWANLTWSAGAFAVSHDVYLGENFADVDAGTGGTFQGNTGDLLYLIVGIIGYPFPEGLVPGTTYYWRVDEVDPTNTYKGDVWSFSVPPKKAFEPTPADGAEFIETDLTLTWTEGFETVAHTVYFGEDFDTVSNATVGAGAGTTAYNPPGPLESGKTYYWRVDEFDGAMTYTGDVWSFTTLPDIPISDPNLVGWWKLDEGQGTTVIDWSGHDNHGTLINGPQWVTGYDGSALELDGSDDYVDFGSPADLPSGLSARSMCAWARADSVAGGYGWIAAYGLGATSQAMFIGRLGSDLIGGGYGGDDLFEYGFWEVGVWHHICLTYDGTMARLYADGTEVVSEAKTWDLVLSRAHIGRQVNNAAEFWNGLVDDVRVYNKVLTQDEVKQAMRGDPLLAWDPKPANGSTPDIDEATPLSWSPGDKASEHDVYLGTDEDAVENADTSTPDIYRGRQSGTSYTPPEGVEWGGGPYYWRIDESNADATVSKGRIWSFSVADFILVDDFEGYDAGNAIWANWHDGLGWVGVDAVAHPGNGTGSEVGDAGTGSYTEESIVNSGRQSMPYWYNNSGSTGKFNYSEAKLTMSAVRDWTKHGVKALSLWFQGHAASVGSFTEAPAGTYTMTASGADITGPSDEFHYAYKILTGPGTIVARVESVENTNDWAKAGVMIRETLDAGSAHAMAFVTPGQGAVFEYRLGPGDNNVGAAGRQQGVTAPYWVKIERDIVGNFTASASSDGSTWEIMGMPQMIGMAADVYIGLGLTSTNTSATCEAVFSNVTITGNVTLSWANQDIGIQSNDPEPMYVAVANSSGAPAVVYHDDPDAAQIDTWTEWNIDLKELQDQGVNLADVNSVALGFGDRNNPQAGGAGKMYFDDIRLYRPRCVPDEVTLSEADLNSDCVVDYRDLEIMVGDWLATGPGLAGDLKVDETVDFTDYAVLAYQWLDERFWPE
jgi:hypothetical protein